MEKLVVESETRRRIRAMTLAGVTPREIAPALNISLTHCYRLLRKMGLKPATGPDEEAAS